MIGDYIVYIILTTSQIILVYSSRNLIYVHKSQLVANLRENGFGLLYTTLEYSLSILYYIIGELYCTAV